MRPESQIRVTALLAVHNRLPSTQRCLSCLRANAAPGVALECLVVDDGSTDETGEWLATQAATTVLPGDGTLWFGGATDRGLRHLLARSSPPEFVLILNNDSYLRPRAIARMLAFATEQSVVSTAYWTEDTHQLASSGYLWNRWRGLLDLTRSPLWEKRRRGLLEAISVDAITTTAVLFSTALLRKATLPSVALHPHNRYDAVLSARLRRAGALFVCVPEVLADHEFGPREDRPSVRTMDVSRFWRESFIDRRSVFHLAGGIAMTWETAPSCPQAIWAVALRLGVFLRQLAWVLANIPRARRPAPAS